MFQLLSITYVNLWRTETRITFRILLARSLAGIEELSEMNEPLYFDVTLSVHTSFSKCDSFCMYFRSRAEIVGNRNGKLKMSSVVVVDFVCCIIKDIHRIEEIDFKSIH